MVEITSNYEQFAAHIEFETQKARMEAPIFLNNPDVLTVGCVDLLTQKGVWNPPGGGLFLDSEGFLPHFYEIRHDRSGIFYVHLDCGYLRVVQDLSRIQGHLRTVKIFHDNVSRFNHIYNAQFQVVVERQGSAASYMR